MESRAYFNIKIVFSKFRDFHYKDKMVVYNIDIIFPGIDLYFPSVSAVMLTI